GCSRAIPLAPTLWCWAGTVIPKASARASARSSTRSSTTPTAPSPSSRPATDAPDDDAARSCGRDSRRDEQMQSIDDLAVEGQRVLTRWKPGFMASGTRASSHDHHKPRGTGSGPPRWDIVVLVSGLRRVAGGGCGTDAPAEVPAGIAGPARTSRRTGLAGGWV